MAIRNKLDHPVLVGLLGIVGFLLAKPTTSADRPGTPETHAAEEQTGLTGHGRDAARPADIPPAGWWAILKRVAAQVSTDRIMTEAAGVTFFSLLAIWD